MRQARLKSAVTSREVSFAIAPMLNAPGRLASAEPTLRLLLADDEATANGMAAELSEANTRRKTISDALIRTALAQVAEVYGKELPRGVVVAGDGWHPGVGGIVAGRLAERLGVATVVVAMDGNEGVGSVRAPRGTKLYDALASCREHLVAFGGHDAAAGLRVRRERLQGFRNDFAVAMRTAGRDGLLLPTVDTVLTEDDFGGALARDLAALEPTGEGNAPPVVKVARARVTETRVVGEQHRRVTLGVGKRSLGCFVRGGAFTVVPAVGSYVTVTGTLRADPWSGPEALQIETDAVGSADGVAGT